MKRTTKATPKRVTAPLVDDAPKPPCNMVKVVSHYRHQLHRHLARRGDKHGIALLFVITSLEAVLADPEVTA